jgi:hypothetical protein
METAWANPQRLDRATSAPGSFGGTVAGEDHVFITLMRPSYASPQRERGTVSMRIPTSALPLVGAGAGLLFGAIAGLPAAGFLTLTGVPPDGGWPMEMRTLMSGVLAGAIVGVCRAMDRCLTEPSAEIMPRCQGFGSADSRRNEALPDRRAPVPRYGRAHRPTWPRSG